MIVLGMTLIVMSFLGVMMLDSADPYQQHFVGLLTLAKLMFMSGLLLITAGVITWIGRSLVWLI